MIVTETDFSGLRIIEPLMDKDDQGFQCLLYSEKDFLYSGLDVHFSEDHWIRCDDASTIRGIHYQSPPYSQNCFLQVLKGGIYAVAVDLRESSPKYRQWFGLELNQANRKSLFIPEGFARGFITTKPDTHLLMKLDKETKEDRKRGIHWEDSELQIDWYATMPVLNSEDQSWPQLTESLGVFP